MKKISLSVLISFALIGCATQNPGSDPLASSIEPLSTLPPLSCDSKASLRTEVRARHIAKTALPNGRDATPDELRTAYAKLEAASSDLNRGVAFDTVWKKYSDQNASGAGGDLGYFKKNVMVPEFEKVAFCLPVGKVSPIFRTVFGYHLLQVTDARN